MIYKILADSMVWLHFLWILFLIGGAFWGVKNKAVRIFHCFGLGIAFLIQSLDLSCPLTYLEVYLRSKHEPALAYSGSFLIYYIEKIVYLQVPHTFILIATILLLGLNILYYFFSWRRRFK